MSRICMQFSPSRVCQDGLGEEADHTSSKSKEKGQTVHEAIDIYSN